MKTRIIVFLLSTLSCIAVAATTPYEKLHNHIAMLHPLAEGDSLVSIGSVGPDTLVVGFVQPLTNFPDKIHFAKIPLSEFAVKRALEMAQKVGISLQAEIPSITTEPSATIKSDSAVVATEMKNVVTPRIISGSRRNNIHYLITQSLYGGYFLGTAPPLILNKKSIIATTLPLSIALSIPLHMRILKHNTITDAHSIATGTYPGLGILTAYSLPDIFLPKTNSTSDEVNTKYRLGAALSLALYPLGLWYGFRQGDALADNPGRMVLRSSFLTNSAVIGGLSSSAFFDNAEFERIQMGVFLATTYAGLFAADLYRKGEYIAEGVGPGISLQMAIGFLTTMYIPINFERGISNRDGIKIWFFGASAGLATALYTHRKDQSSPERPVYDLLGTGAGALVGMGLFHRLEGKTFGNALLSTTLLGYGITHYLTRNMQESMPVSSGPSKISINFVPEPEPVLDAMGKLDMRVRVQGIVARF